MKEGRKKGRKEEKMEMVKRKKRSSVKINRIYFCCCLTSFNIS
jgi:hypothetical protein